MKGEGEAEELEEMVKTIFSRVMRLGLEQLALSGSA